MAEPAPDFARHARHLILIAADLRAAGDIPLVALSAEGVTRTATTLADELWLIASQLDWNAAMDAVQCPECGATSAHRRTCTTGEGRIA